MPRIALAALLLTSFLDAQPTLPPLRQQAEIQQEWLRLRLDRLEGFAGFFGADYYGLPRNTEKMTLVKESWPVPASVPLGPDTLVPLRAGAAVDWKIAGT